MIVRRYIRVLRKHFILFYRRIRLKHGSQVIIQEGNAPWHKAKTIRAFLEK